MELLAIEALSYFDRGVAIAVLIFCGGVAIILIRRWLKAMDSLDIRDANNLLKIAELTEKHQDKIIESNEKHHNELLDMARRQSEERRDQAAALQAILSKLEK